MIKKFKFMSSIGIVLVLLVSTIILAEEDDDEDEHNEDQRILNEGRGARELATLPVHANFKKECTSCHMAYHPGLLPERSWKKLMSNLSNHFGEDASLDSKTKADIEKFLIEHSGDKSQSRRSLKITQSISKSETPLRITETSYFKNKHDEISASIYKRPKIGSSSNCLACHKGAENGYFSEREVKIPKL